MNGTAIVRSDYSPRQKAAHIALLFSRGSAYTASQVAEMFGMTPTGAHMMLGRISGVLPVVVDEPQNIRGSNGQFAGWQAGRWRRFDND